jgi:hypothetical protein
MLLIRVRPEQTEQRIAAVKTVRLRNAKVGEQGNALRLGEQ